MATKQPDRQDWRDFLKPAERKEVDDLECEAKRLHVRRGEITRDLFQHRSRCLARRKLAEQHAAARRIVAELAATMPAPPEAA